MQTYRFTVKNKLDTGKMSLFSKANKKSLKIKPNGEISTSWSEE